MKKKFLKKLFLLLFIIYISLSATFIYAYQYQETQNLVNLVDDAAKLVEQEGEKAFDAFTDPKTRWLSQDTYIFVVDSDGNYLINGKLENKAIIDKDNNPEKFKKYFLFEAFGYKNKNTNWVHYLYHKSNDSIPVWKSTYTKKVKAPSGKEYVIASGKYNLKLEKEFVEDEMNKISELIKDKNQLAFPIIRNNANYFFSSENFVFIIDTDGNVLFNTGKPYIENNNILKFKDSFGTFFINNIIKDALVKNNGWSTYYYPRSDDTNPSLKNIYFKTAQLNDKKIIIAYSVIFSDTIVVRLNKAEDDEIYEIKYLAKKISGLIKEKGINHLESNLKEMNLKNNVFVMDSSDGMMLVNLQNQNLLNRSMANTKDQLGKPIWKNMNLTLDLNEDSGWVHFIFETNSDANPIMPVYKSRYLMRVKSEEDNKNYILGITKNSENMEKEFIEQAVNMAIKLIKQKKQEAFKEIKNPQNIFIFKKIHFFITDEFGMQILDSEYPYLEGTNLLKNKDSNGEFIVYKYIQSALKNSSTWIDYPFIETTNSTTVKSSMFVKKVTIDNKNYIVGAEYWAKQ